MEKEFFLVAPRLHPPTYLPVLHSYLLTYLLVHHISVANKECRAMRWTIIVSVLLLPVDCVECE